MSKHPTERPVASQPGLADSFEYIRAVTLQDVPHHVSPLYPAPPVPAHVAHRLHLHRCREKFAHLQREMDDIIRRIANETLGLMTVQEFPGSQAFSSSAPNGQVRVESIHKFILQFIELFQINSDNFFQIVNNDYFQMAESAAQETYRGTLKQGNATLQAVEFMERFDMAHNSAIAESDCRQVPVSPVAQPMLPADQFKTSLDRKVIVSEVMDGVPATKTHYSEGEFESKVIDESPENQTDKFRQWKHRLQGLKFLRSSFLEAVNDADQNEPFSWAVLEKLEAFYVNRLRPLKASDHESKNLSDFNFEINFSAPLDAPVRPGSEVVGSQNSQMLLSDVVGTGVEVLGKRKSEEEIQPKPVGGWERKSRPENGFLESGKQPKQLENRSNYTFTRKKPMRANWQLASPLQLLVSDKKESRRASNPWKPSNLSSFCPQNQRDSITMAGFLASDVSAKENHSGKSSEPSVKLASLFQPKQSVLTDKTSGSLATYDDSGFDVDTAYMELALQEFDLREKWEAAQRQLRVALKQAESLKGILQQTELFPKSPKVN